MTIIQYRSYEEMPAYNHRYRPADWPDDEEYHEVFQLASGGWFAVMEDPRGGNQRTSAKDTQKEAEAEIYKHVQSTRRFWDQKIEWMNNGDKTIPDRFDRDKKPRQVIRCGGHHYVIGPEPSKEELRRNRDLYGHGGSGFKFRLLATGEEIESHNVWSQGKIDPEYLSVLTDNAEDITPPWPQFK
jgi:hypothetical protein